jgi:hypothetical protein
LRITTGGGTYSETRIDRVFEVNEIHRRDQRNDYAGSLFDFGRNRSIQFLIEIPPG